MWLYRKMLFLGDADLHVFTFYTVHTYTYAKKTWRTWVTGCQITRVWKPAVLPSSFSVGATISNGKHEENEVGRKTRPRGLRRGTAGGSRSWGAGLRSRQEGWESSCFQSYPTFGGSSSSARRGCEKAAVPAFPSPLLLPEETTFQTRRGLLAWPPVCTITAPIVSLSLPALNIIGGCLNWERGGCTVPYSHTPFIHLQPIHMILASFSLDWSSVFILSFRHIHGIQKISAHQFYHVFLWGGGGLHIVSGEDYLKRWNTWYTQRGKET